MFGDYVTLVLCPSDKMSAESDSGCAGPAPLPGSVYSPSDLELQFSEPMTYRLDSQPQDGSTYLSISIQIALSQANKLSML